MNHVEHLKSLYAAFGEGDMETVLGGMDPKIEWREAEGNPYSPSSGEAFHGPNEILNKLFTRLAEEWDNFEVSPQSYHGAGENVIVEGRYTGTFKATGKSQDSPFCHVWKYNGDKVSKFQQYTNTAALQDVMGVTAAT